MEKELISVIVPVYNAEKYLQKCLDSILEQTYKNLEIIIINDGSTDNSGQICQEYEKQDDRIVYIEKENSGVSDTRNAGMDRMTGPYVTFVDSDDWLEPNYVKFLYEKLIEHQADIVVGNYTSFNESNSVFYFHTSADYYEKVYDNKSVIPCLYDAKELLKSALIVPWGKIYKKEIIANFRFPIDRIGEDALFNLKALLGSKKVVYVNKSAYIYRVREGSLSNTWTDEWIRDAIYIIEERLSLLATLGYPLSEHRRAYKMSLDYISSEAYNRGLANSHELNYIKEKKMLLDRLLPQSKEDKKAVVLAADFSNLDQVVTTIKSICYHNRSVRFYIINRDFPKEWFIQLNGRLRDFDSEIINCRVTSDQISRFKTDISYVASLCYFIPDFVKEDKALYLDCDLVVTKNLDDLFATDLQGYPLAAVRDYGRKVYYDQEIFNVGVLLINNLVWKQESMTQRLINLTDEQHDKADQVDQLVLNKLFENKWLELDFDNNYIVSHKQFTDYKLPKSQDYPGIIHYPSNRKPWDNLGIQAYRNVWWYYHNLEWTELGQNYHLHTLKKAHIYPQKLPVTCLIYTFSDRIEQLESLVQALPEIQFIIVARVKVSDQLTKRIVNPNVTILSDFNDLSELEQELIEISQVLLDINHGEKNEEIMEQFAKLGKPILAFENTKYSEVGQIIYKVEQVQEMINKIREVEDKYGF